MWSTLYEKELKCHRAWLDRFGCAWRAKWECLWAADPEAATMEALTRELLQRHVPEVKPNDDPSSGGPDFCCVQDKQLFYVEATCMREEVVTKETALTPRPQGAQSYGLLTERVLDECRNKAAQCADLDAACLLAIGTLHFQASAICFDEHHIEDVLTGAPKIAHLIDTTTGEPIGETFETTDLGNASFLRLIRDSDAEIEHARRSISGLLLCGFGCEPWNITGLLHPHPVRPFDRGLLPNVRFCRLKPEYREGQFEVEWI